MPSSSPQQPASAAAPAAADARARRRRAGELFQAGRLADAEVACAEILAADPEDAWALYLRAMIAAALGRLEDAAAGFEQASAADPTLPDYALNLAVALQRLGRSGDALAACDRALALAPDHAQAHFTRATLLEALGDAAGAEAGYARAVALDPNLAVAHNNLGNLLLGRGRVDDALAALDRAVAANPAFALAQINRGRCLMQLQRYSEALAAADAAIRLSPAAPLGHFLRGQALRNLGRPGEALAAFEHATFLAPDEAATRVEHGLALQDLGRWEEALARHDEALERDPACIAARINRGTVLKALKRFADALADYDTALRLAPGNPEALINRAILLADEGRTAEALAAHRLALAAAPGSTLAISNYLWTLLADPAQDARSLFEANREFGRRHGRPAGAIARHSNSRDPDRPLRIGLVSPNLCRHPVGFFALPLFRALDPGRVRLCCYSGVAQPDEITEALRRACTGWRSSIGRTDAELAALIRADGIDVLIDLAGHGGGNRLACFALKPAPVQMSWVGYPVTTGLDAIDAVISDAASVPPGDERWFVEAVIRLPDSRFCYAPPAYAPPVAPAPCRARGVVTLGSFNNVTKYNDAVFDLWARVLAALPESRLFLSWKTLSDPGEQARLIGAFTARGVAAERLTLTAGDPAHARVLADYDQVDVALDPFPLNGGLTTCEALWMGVPVITLAGRHAGSRQTASILRALGRPEWIADDADDYVEVVAEIARTPDWLAELRAEQRPRMAASALCDAPRFARHFEAALRAMWQKWCIAQETPASNGGDD
jgi:predicted O-linked N-acetylglucosamine transferase (SPINDLY family)